MLDVHFVLWTPADGSFCAIYASLHHDPLPWFSHSFAIYGWVSDTAIFCTSHSSDIVHVSDTTGSWILVRCFSSAFTIPDCLSRPPYTFLSVPGQFWLHHRFVCTVLSATTGFHTFPFAYLVYIVSRSPSQDFLPWTVRTFTFLVGTGLACLPTGLTPSTGRTPCTQVRFSWTLHGLRFHQDPFASARSGHTGLCTYTHTPRFRTQLFLPFHCIHCSLLHTSFTLACHIYYTGPYLTWTLSRHTLCPFPARPETCLQTSPRLSRGFLARVHARRGHLVGITFTWTAHSSYRSHIYAMLVWLHSLFLIYLFIRFNFIAVCSHATTSSFGHSRTSFATLLFWTLSFFSSQFSCFVSQFFFFFFFTI